MNKSSANSASDAGNAEQRDSPVIFLSYPFGSREVWIKQYMPLILRRQGYEVAEGSQLEGLGISGAVCTGIAAANAMVAFVTKCRKLVSGGWATSDWVLQEIGFARGKGLPVIVIVEKSVNVNLGLLGDIQKIELDPKAPYHALIRLRLALGIILRTARQSDEIRVEHIARMTKRVSGKQWWDFWTWLDAPPQKLANIDSVSYHFPSSFRPLVETGKNRGYGFGNYGETDGPFELRVIINHVSAPAQELSHLVTLLR
jgi:hypothetical protein